MATEPNNMTTIQPENNDAEETVNKLKKTNISFSIWPPSQRTREAVITRLIETLSTTSILSKRYDTVPPDEATGVAERIEDEAFIVAGSVADDDDSIEILQVYSKEISKRVLDYMKSRCDSNGESSTVKIEG